MAPVATASIDSARDTTAFGSSSRRIARIGVVSSVGSSAVFAMTVLYADVRSI